MPSSAKTTHLGLNRFSGTDKPKMEDFNFDNLQLDQQVGGHLVDTALHLSAQDRQNLGALELIQGSYTGNGQTSRAITLSADAAFGLVFCPGDVLWQPSPAYTGQAIVNGGFFTPAGCTAGLTLSGRTLTVLQHSGSATGEAHYNLNVQDLTYQYAFFKLRQGE